MASFSNAAKSAVLWFRNDLRVHDQPLLHAVAQQLQDKSPSKGKVLCVYCFDPSHYVRTPFGSPKTASYRALFLVESVANLRLKLRAMGSDLFVALEQPDRVIPKILNAVPESKVYVQAEATHEEICVENAVAAAIGRDKLHILESSSTLFHLKDIPFRPDCKDVPDTFTPFKEKVEKITRVPRPEFPTETVRFSDQVAVTGKDLSVIPTLASSPTCGFDYLPSVEDLMSLSGCTTTTTTTTPPSSHPPGVMEFKGGEDEALARLNSWMFRDDNLRNYFDIRNGMLGEAYSSKLSPWLACGCISPRRVYYEAKKYEKERVSNKSTYWLVFELIWRDFYRFICIKYGRRIFFPSGAKNMKKVWSSDAEAITRWKTGTTGVPLVDACMRELLATGWMSNRGRQNVASYLVLDLGIDWRVGADHFESLLLDHDVCSNYGNWNAAAGLFGGRINKFNIPKQSRDYDANGDFVRYWIPEIKNVPAPLCFEPHRLSAAERQRLGVGPYPSPLEVSPYDGRNGGGGGVGGGAGMSGGGRGGSGSSGGHGGGRRNDRDRDRELKRREGGNEGGASGGKSAQSNNRRRENRVQHL